MEKGKERRSGEREKKGEEEKGKKRLIQIATGDGIGDKRKDGWEGSVKVTGERKSSQFVRGGMDRGAPGLR
ncbi:hypothetical protein Pmani_036215 [Petrolisthes manimaculis]|uniref:Uncharacterized protein n=1 Tax=Petrolisthes manimaculis TaxID=1843537 RepID=A0AAE1NJ69_9EUCA|nr:hypothetical protein Pmani_036215 [Petrolisthes manimaculis]